MHSKAPVQQLQECRPLTNRSIEFIYQAMPFLGFPFLPVRLAFNFFTCLWLIQTGYRPWSSSIVFLLRLRSKSILPASAEKQQRSYYGKHLSLTHGLKSYHNMGNRSHHHPPGSPHLSASLSTSQPAPLWQSQQHLSWWSPLFLPDPAQLWAVSVLWGHSSFFSLSSSSSSTCCANSLPSWLTLKTTNIKVRHAMTKTTC